MKICPACSFSNDECYPTCIVCHAILVDVPSTPSENPDNPEHEQRELLEKRHRITRRQIRSAGIFYGLVITILAVCPGLVFSPQALLLYFLSSMVVAIAITQDLAGQFSAPLLQGILSVILIAYFGPLQPLIFFMLAGHISMGAVLWHWTDMIYSAHR